MNIIYVSHIPQDSRMNWVSMTAKTLSKFQQVHQVIHFDLYKPSIEFKKIIFSIKIGDFLKQIKKMYSKKYVDFTFYEIIPFKRFQIIQKMNIIVNLLIIRFFFLMKNKPVVLISSYSTSDWISIFIKYIKFDLIIGDCTDIWPIRDIRYMNSICDIFCVNSLSMQQYVNKFSNKTQLISPGYFPSKLIKKLIEKSNQNKCKKEKNIVLITSINWRANFSFINNILDRLPDFNFFLIGPNLFDYFKESGWDYKNVKAEKEWKRLKQRKKFRHFSINDQTSLHRLSITNAIGIITYDINDRFNKFCHPIKVYQYLALGFPVVSVPVPSILYLSEISDTYFANNASQFAQKIKDIYKKIQNNSNSKKNVVKIVTDQTYEKKSAQLINIIQNNI